jgi:hypothetical protein
MEHTEHYQSMNLKPTSVSCQTRKKKKKKKDKDAVLIFSTYIIITFQTASHKNLT